MNNSGIRKLEDENAKLKESVSKQKNFSEKKIQEISDKLNRGINVNTVIKEIANATEFSKKLEVSKLVLLPLSF